MSTYGWQVFGSDGALLYDNSVIMSRRLGTYDIGFVKRTDNFSVTIGGLQLNGGTPFAHCTQRSGLVVPSGYVFSSIPPDIVMTSDSITISYPASLFNYPDDLGSPLCLGAYTVNYGVYNQ